MGCLIRGCVMDDRVVKRGAKNILFIMCDQLRWDYLSCYGHLHFQSICYRNSNYSPSGARHWSDDGQVDKLHLTSATHLSNYSNKGREDALTEFGLSHFVLTSQ